jgi:hypothetical protein
LLKEQDIIKRSSLISDLTAEIADRKTVDTNKSKSRGDGDVALGLRIDSEIVDRKSADTSKS